SLDDEALRVVSAMPKWTPGRQNGEAVRVKYTIPVAFRLGSHETPKADGSFQPAESTGEQVEIDEEGRITINGKEVKRYLFEQPIVIANFMVNHAEHFDYVIDGNPLTSKELLEKNSTLNPIMSIEYVQKDSEHPKDRLLITTKKTE
nr:energy transducer TonB [Prevotella sp.]